MKDKSKAISLRKNAILNIVKQTCSIIFPLITIPYATRILGATYYGKVNYAASIISYFSLLAGLGINNYGIRSGSQVRDDPEKFNKFCNEVFSINLISTVFAYVVLFIIANIIPLLRGYRILLLILSMQIIFTTIGTDWINTVFEDYLYISIRYVICTLAALILMYIFVRKPDDYLKYAFTSIASIVFANIANIQYIRKKFHLHIKFVLQINLRKHIIPILILFCTAVASVVYINSDITMLGILKDETTVGLYSSSAKLHSFIVQFFSSIEMVFVPRISFAVSHNAQRQADNILNKLLGDLLLLILPVSAGVILLSRPIIVLLCGKAFETASSSFAILNTALPFSVLSYFFYWVVMVPFQMEGKFLLATILSAITNVVLNFFLIPLWGQNATAITTLISELIMFFLGIYFLHNKIKFSILREMCIGISGAVITSIVTYIVIKFNCDNFATIFISIIASLLAYLLVLCIFEKNKIVIIFKRISMFINRKRG